MHRIAITKGAVRKVFEDWYADWEANSDQFDDKATAKQAADYFWERLKAKADSNVSVKVDG